MFSHERKISFYGAQIGRTELLKDSNDLFLCGLFKSPKILEWVKIISDIGIKKNFILFHTFMLLIQLTEVNFGINFFVPTRVLKRTILVRLTGQKMCGRQSSFTAQ